MKTQIRNYKHFGECLWLENGMWELGIPTSFGPRVLYFAQKGLENVFYEQPADADYLCTPEGWRIYGGTRLWLAPESAHALYAPEQNPVSTQWHDDTLVVTQVEDKNLHVMKQIEISEGEDPLSVDIVYRITNTGKQTLTGAPWAVSVMRAGGVLTVPFEAKTREITAKPDRILSLWNTTSLNDPRLSFTNSAVEIAQRTQDDYFKVGLCCAAGTASYALEDQILTKTFPVNQNSVYPDGGVNLEVYACRWMLEFETLAPLGTILPDESVEHAERWTICSREGEGVIHAV
ncbi:MAG: hypothetical protein Q8S22_04395 [Eubacteriales bacterium]|jgi:hypothetical protein|nr:hypothetical protein [Eubacteriales bacterium]